MLVITYTNHKFTTVAGKMQDEISLAEVQQTADTHTPHMACD